MAVDYRDFITASVSEHLDAVAGFVLFQTADSVDDVI
jgi:hypothetical protein